MQMIVFLYLEYCWRAYLTEPAMGETTQTGILSAGSKLFGMVVPDRFKGSVGLEVYKAYG